MERSDRLTNIPGSCQREKRARRWGLLLVLGCGGLSVLWGCSIGWNAYKGPLDFQAVYFGARTLIGHHDPYIVGELDSVYRVEGGMVQAGDAKQHKLITLFVNTPGTVLLVAPFAVLPLGFAQVLWTILISGSLVLASVLMWSIAAKHDSMLSACLIGFLLLNCQVLIAAGNTAAIVVGFAVIATWCFVRDRFVLAGVLCMAISLAIKPHDTGLVLLYFLLAPWPFRKSAIQSGILTAVITALAMLWLWSVAPHWMSGWQTNLAAISAPGGMNDPRPGTVVGVGAGNVTSLQAIFSIFSANASFYNTASFAVCGAILVPWAFATFRFRATTTKTWIALATIAPLTMLITYHRVYDAKLLLLCIPACAMLWAGRGRLGWIALVLTSAGVVLNADIPLAVFGILIQKLSIPVSTFSGKLLTILIARPNQEILLAMSVFYLWVYMRSDFAVVREDAGDSERELGRSMPRIMQVLDRLYLRAMVTLRPPTRMRCRSGNSNW